MAMTDIVNQVIVGVFMLLILVNIIGTLQPDLAEELENEETHPQGGITLTILGFFGLAVAIRILLLIFEKGKSTAEELGLR